MSRNLNKNVRELSPSRIRKFQKLAETIQDPITMALGEPDFDTPEHIKEAANEALRKGYTRYSPTAGFEDLREAISKKLRRENRINSDPSNIIVTVGATEGIFLAMQVLLNPGDEALIPNPGFDKFADNVVLAGCKPVYFPLKEEKQFRIDPEEVSSSISERTKALIINSPHNPTGSILRRRELEEIADLAIEHNFHIVSDEVYEKIIYDGEQHVSMASLSGMKEKVITVNAFSKAYAMTGWRIGYIVSSEDLSSNMMKIHRATVGTADSIAQKAALAALEGPQDFVRRTIREYDERRKVLIKGLKQIDGISYTVPKGTFYAFPNISKFNASSDQFAEYLIKQVGVVSVPGVAFGSNGEGFLRLSYTLPKERIQEAVSRMKSVLLKE